MTRRQALPIAIAIVALAIGAVGSHELFPSGAAAPTASAQYGVDQAKARANPVHTVTPYVGPFNLHGCGPAITELDRALILKHFRTTKAAPCYGVPTAHQVANFQRSIHYKPTGHYSLVTHQALVKRHGYTFAARGRLITLAHIRYVQSYRNAVVRVSAHVALVGGSTLVYSQNGGMRQTFPAWPRIPPYSDCSGIVIFIEYQSGAGIAVGYFGPGSIVGYTGTLGRQGRAVPFGAKLYPGDVILYGRFPHYHAAIYIGRGLVLSHGGRGVNILPWNYNGDVGAIRRMVA